MGRPFSAPFVPPLRPLTELYDEAFSCIIKELKRVSEYSTGGRLTTNTDTYANL
jgi:hypothetical protein